MKTALEGLIEEGMLPDCIDAINEMVGIIGHATLPEQEIADSLTRIDSARNKHWQRLQADLAQAQLLNTERRTKNERSNSIVGHVVMST